MRNSREEVSNAVFFKDSSLVFSKDAHHKANAINNYWYNTTLVLHFKSSSKNVYEVDCRECAHRMMHSQAHSESHLNSSVHSTDSPWQQLSLSNSALQKTFVPVDDTASAGSQGWHCAQNCTSSEPDLGNNSGKKATAMIRMLLWKVI